MLFLRCFYFLFVFFILFTFYIFYYMAGGGRTIKAVVACHLSHKPFVKPGNSVIQEYMRFCFSYGPSHGILTSRCLEVFRVYNFPSAGALATLAGFWAQVYLLTRLLSYCNNEFTGCRYVTARVKSSGRT